MLENEKLQLAGPIALIAAIMCAELAAHALASWPASSFLWYLNLVLFRSFRHSLDGIAGLQWLDAIGLAQPVWIAFALAVLVCLGLVAKIRLSLAMASNFSLIYSACLLYSSLATNDFGKTIGVRLIDLSTPSIAPAAAILIASLFSSTISHRRYWHEIFS